MIRFRSRDVTSLVLSLLCAFAGIGGAQPPATTAPRALTADQWRADLAAMMDALPRVHANLYHATSKEVFDSAARALHDRIPTLGRDEIIMEMARLVALAHDGHSNIYPTRDAVIGFHALPVALYYFSDGLYVRAADQAHADLVSARVLRVGGVSSDSAFALVRPYIGHDNEMGARFFASQLLAMPEVLHALHLAPSADSVELVLDTRAGRRTVWLKPAGLAPLMAGDTDRSWRRRAGWIDARDVAGSQDPLWLRVAPDTVLCWFTSIPGTSAVYAQINQIRNVGPGSMDAFADTLLAYVDSSSVDRLVIDLRLDRGGNGELRQHLVRELLRRPRINAPGKLFVLIGRTTFSAAQFLVDDLDQYSYAMFVGEPTGSRGNHYGDSRQTKLPNSGITVRAATRYWQDWSPDDERPWTAPDIAAEMSFADYAANRDPALTAAMAYTASPTLDQRLRAFVAVDDTGAARATLSTFRATPANRYADVHRLIDVAALHFYERKDIPRATWLFTLAAESFPESVQAWRNVAAMHELGKNPVLERAALERVVRLQPGDEGARRRLEALRGPN